MSTPVPFRIDSVRRVFDDGNHNAFTDLCLFKDRYYLTFRTCPDGHKVFHSSWITVMSSEDAQEWDTVHTFSVPNRDVRDPHFLVFGDKLFVYSGCWSCDPSRPPETWSDYRDINDHLGYCAWSDDGESWQGPRFLEGTYGHYIWRAASFGGKAYLCGRRIREFVRTPTQEEAVPLIESALLQSEDGFVWRTVGLFQEEYGSETAFLFEEDGSILAVARGKLTRPAQICRSSPPYRDWTRVDLDRDIGGPLLAKWNGVYLVGGRKMKDPKKPRTVLYVLSDDRLREIAELPSGGDNSYPGFVQLDETRGLLSWYSSHEGSGTGLPPCSIYTAELSRS